MSIKESSGPVWSGLGGVKLRRRISFAQPAILSFLVAVPIASKQSRYRHTASSSSARSRSPAPGRSCFGCCPAHRALNRHIGTLNSCAAAAILGLSSPQSDKTSIACRIQDSVTSLGSTSNWEAIIGTPWVSARASEQRQPPPPGRARA